MAWLWRFAASAGVAALALGGATVAVIVLAVALIVQASTASQMEHRAAAVAAQAHEVSLASLALLQAITDAETGQRGYLLTGQSQFLQPYHGARSRAEDALQTLSRLASSDPDYGSRLLPLSRLTERRLSIIERTIELAQSGRRDQALVLLDTGREVMTELRAQLGGLLASAQADEAVVRAERSQFEEQARSLQVGLAAVTVLALTIAIASLAHERNASRRAAAVQARLNDELRAARNSADEANRAKSRFLATASHDMRQPLHALALYISSLDRRVESPQAREILANMDSAVRAMTRLFNALLDLARLEAGVLKPEPMDFALGSLLKEVAAQSVDPRAREVTRVRVAPTSLEVRSDPDLLEVVLRNLASNAVKHSKGEVLIGCRRVGHEVRIDVHDNGQGIPKDQIGQLFDEFVRGPDAESTEGIGLGLAIVERMAKLLGHRLSVRSEPGRGSVFSITLPRATSAPVVDRLEAVDSFHGARILVADDEPLALDSMRRAYEDLGAQVTTAASAEQVRALAAQAFDLYVFDLNLGRDDGLELLDEVNAAKAGLLAGLIVTGATTPEVLARLREAGWPWITKPASVSALAAAAGELLAGRG